MRQDDRKDILCNNNSSKIILVVRASNNNEHASWNFIHNYNILAGTPVELKISKYAQF